MPAPMPTDVTVQPATFDAPVPPLAPAQPAPTPPAAPAVSTDTTDGQPARQVLQIPSNAMSKIRKDERAKGAKAHQKKLDDEARALGFENHAALIAFAQERKGRQGARGTSATPAPTAPAAAPARRTTPATTPVVSVRSTPEEDAGRTSGRRLTEIRSRDRLLAQERKKLRRTQHDLNAERAANVLRIAALRAGVTDVDYALHLARVHVRTIPPSKLKTFDENKFFAETLRESHPHLFATQAAPATPAPKPATTGPSGGEPAPAAPGVPRSSGAPAPQNGTPPAPSTGPRDMRHAKPEEVQARLQQLGLSPPGSSLPI